MFGIAAVIMSATNEVQQHNYEMAAIRNLRRSMSPEDFDKVMELRRKQQKADRKYRQKLAIAREGRSLNFWGNR